MRRRFWGSMITGVLLCGGLCTPCAALKVMPDPAKVEAEAKSIEQMAATGDVDGLIRMLSEGEFPSKEAAAKCLGEVGDERALPELKRLNSVHGGWVLWGFIDEDRSGAFAVAICRIQTRNQPEKARVEALLDLVDGKGPAVPDSIEPPKMTINGVPRPMALWLDRNRWIGESVTAELDKFDDPAITPRLRRSENQGVSPYAVWREVRGMETEAGVARCVQIARDEGGAQRYGAIHCLARYGRDGTAALDQLAKEGHGEAITVLGRRTDDPNVFDLVCWHLANNKSSLVRMSAVNAVAYVRGNLQMESLKALVGALYDPGEHIRRNAARALSNRAYKQNKQFFDQIEDSLLIALKHPDPEVRTSSRTALERLGCGRLNEAVPEPPPIRTDLEARSGFPSAAEQRLKTLVDPLEKEAAEALKWGPAERAVELYEKLIELKPGFGPYEEALKTAKAYVTIAARATESWRPDASYIGLKGRYSSVLACTRYDVAHLKEVFELEADLTRVAGSRMSRPKGDPATQELDRIYLKLFEHVVEHYPENESLVVRARLEASDLRYDLSKDFNAYLSSRIDLFTIPIEQVVDSTDDSGNVSMAQYKGRTRAQFFVEHCKDRYRRSTIDAIKAGRKLHYLLDTIVEKCSQSDPEIVEMAKAAKAEIAEMERFEAEKQKEWLLRKQNEPH